MALRSLCETLSARHNFEVDAGTDKDFTENVALVVVVTIRFSSRLEVRA
jgi:hypothetical protein